MDVNAAGVATVESKVTGGRVQIPASVRRTLGLADDDRLLWVSDSSGVRVTTRRALTEEVWAANTGGDAIDTAAEVREMRRGDVAQERRGGGARAWEGVDTDDAVLDELFGA
ncbi:hypothetical protein GCM10010124_05580 [Pilimelia terevasa]|uniref:Uncharacterized protein n=2 Tax=Pilimelia terevasa TaxID=53372 RepID=A0A8J3FEX7_9ACTN|nr:hypothetical protein GCM10010124_05580 [Pilimelia terevasa]